MGMGEALMVAAGGRWGPAPCGRAGMVLPSQPASRLAHRRADLKRQPTRFRLSLSPCTWPATLCTPHRAEHLLWGVSVQSRTSLSVGGDPSSTESPLPAGRPLFWHILRLGLRTEGLTLQAWVCPPSVGEATLTSGHPALTSYQMSEQFIQLSVVSSLWGKLLLTQRWVAGAFCAGRPDSLLRCCMGLAAWVCLVGEVGLRGPSPPCCSG